MNDPLDWVALQSVKAELDEFEARCAQIGGCTNHGCVVVSKPPGSMGTNSICQCWADKMKMQRFAYAVAALRKSLKEIVA